MEWYFWLWRGETELIKWRLFQGTLVDEGQRQRGENEREEKLGTMRVVDKNLWLESDNTRLFEIYQFSQLFFIFVVMKEENCLTDQTYVPSNYSKAYHQYGKTQIKFVMPFLTSIAQTCYFGHQFPVDKVLKAVSKFFLLNQIEVIFLAYLIRSTGWDIQDKIISSNAQNIQNIVFYSNDSIDYKKTILYLMVSAYTVKYYLNSNTSLALEEATKRCPNFKKVFECWAKKHIAITSKINPRILHIVYQELYTNVRKQKKDYNLMVDSILNISPAYNPEKDKQKKDQKKRNQLFSLPYDQPVAKQEQNGYIPAHPLFSPNQILSVFQPQPNKNIQFNLNEGASNVYSCFNDISHDKDALVKKEEPIDYEETEKNREKRSNLASFSSGNYPQRSINQRLERKPG